MSDHRDHLDESPAMGGNPGYGPGRRIALASVATWVVISVAGWSTVFGTALLL